jgi:hypothetical protein
MCDLRFTIYDLRCEILDLGILDFGISDLGILDLGILDLRSPESETRQSHLNAPFHFS